MNDLIKSMRSLSAGHEQEGWPATALCDGAERLQAELNEQARLNGMGSEREARLMARVEELERELAQVRAERDHWEATCHAQWENHQAAMEAVKAELAQVKSGYQAYARTSDRQFQALRQQIAEAEPVTSSYKRIEDIATERYKVAPSHESMFYRYAVIAGDGKWQIYIGREAER